MSKDHTERRLYRKSPGRQYGYEYDPLQTRSEPQKRGQSGHLSQSTEITDRSSTQLVQRPDLRRTRQLLRQNILASKRPTGEDDEDEQLELENPEMSEAPGHAEQEEFVEYERPGRNRYRAQLPAPIRRDPLEGDFDEAMAPEDWQDFSDIDPDLGYEEEEPEARPRYVYVEELPARPRSAVLPAAPTPMQIGKRSRQLAKPVIIDDDEYADDDDFDRRGKRKVSRRGLIAGVGIVALGGAGVAAYELIPKIPQAVGNIEHQVQDAFNKGVAQGADAARKAFLTELDNLEGFSLQGAVSAAKLTRVAYDVFVSPIVKFGSALTANFLSTMLSGFKAARRVLAYIGQDNDTLGAIQSVLETWVQDVTNLPKQLDAITQTDLDGAQAYLNALQQKIETEKAKLNGTAATPVPTGTGTKTPATTPTATH